MPIDIPSLFSDIIESPEQKRTRLLTEGTLLGRELTSGLRGLAATQAPLVSALGQRLPQQREDIRRGVGGMLGLDVRTQGEKVEDILGSGFETDAKGLRELSRKLVKIAPVQAAGLMQAADERELFELNKSKLQGDVDRQELETLSQAKYRIFAADQMRQDPKFRNFADPTEKGIIPMTRVEAIMTEMLPEDDKESLTGVVVLDQGRRFDALWNGGSIYYTPDGQTQLQISDNAQIFNRPTITSTLGDVRQSAELQERIDDYRFKTNNYVDTVVRAVEFYEENENANTTTAELSSAVGTLEQNLDALGEIAQNFYGSSTPENERMAREAGYESTGDKQGLLNYLSELGITNAEAQSVALNVALQYAAAIGLGSGRSLTDKDLALALRAVGVSRQNKDQIVGSLKRSLVEVLGTYNTFNRTYVDPEQQVQIINPFEDNVETELDSIY
jgi:hypothetical protein